MPEPADQDTPLPAHVPMRLSDDSLVKEYLARDHVATGTALHSNTDPSKLPATAPVPPEMLPRRAKVDDVSARRRGTRVETQVATSQPGAPRPAPDRSQLNSSEIVVSMLRLMSQPWDREPSPMEHALLRSAEALFSELAERAAELTRKKSAPKTAKRTAKKAKAGKRRS